MFKEFVWPIVWRMGTALSFPILFLKYAQNVPTQDKFLGCILALAFGVITVVFIEEQIKNKEMPWRKT